MNRKQKIIVSITGIVIVVLALLGLTYAYFITQIQGNNSDKSIEVSTANLKLVYGDGNGLFTANNIMPDNDNPAITKTFTVSNTGNTESSYIAVLENVAYKNTTDNSSIDGFTRQEDLKYTLTCKQFNESDVETGTCDSVTDVTFPSTTNMSIMVSNKIPTNYVHKYTLVINYIDPGVDQSGDMGKGFSAKVNIRDIKMSNPYATLSGETEVANDTLAYNIINNAKLNKNGTSLVNMPLTKPAEETTMKYIDGGEETEGNTTPTSTNIFTYGDSYNFNEITGNYDIVNEDASALNTGTLSEKYSDMIGKYVVSYSGSASVTAGTNKSTIYKVTSNTTSIKIYYKPITKNSINYVSRESSLSITPDDYGISYYFRGGVKDNYLNYSGMCFRIVRVEGDGSIKLLLADAEGVCSTDSTTLDEDSAFLDTEGDINTDYGYKDDYKADYLNIENRTSSMKYKLDKFLTGPYPFYSFDNEGNQIIKYYNELNLTKLKDDIWCLGDQTSLYDYNTGILLTDSEVASKIENDANANFYYETGKRLFLDKKATLKCKGEVITSKIGTLTADETVYAGASADISNFTYYLYDNATTNPWWNMSLILFSNYDSDFASLIQNQNETSSFSYYFASQSNFDSYAIKFRVVITLLSGTEISGGDGTLTHPYVVNES